MEVDCNFLGHKQGAMRERGTVFCARFMCPCLFYCTPPTYPILRRGSGEGDTESVNARGGGGGRDESGGKRGKESKKREFGAPL